MKKPIRSATRKVAKGSPAPKIEAPPPPQPAQRTFHGLRDVLFDEINALRGPNPDPRRALAVSSLAKQIVGTVRAELMVAKESLAIREAGGDAQVGMLALGSPVNAVSAGILAKAH